jgi:dihydrofolate synthase/folylpolyglutamate synthase
LQRDPPIVLDGAHNPGGARALAASLAAYFPGRPLTLVVGMSTDKDVPAMLGALAPLAHRLILTAAAHPRAARPADLAAALHRTGLAVPGGVEVADTAAAALDRALAAPETAVICIAGSLFLVGEVLALRGACPDILADSPAPR